MKILQNPTKELVRIKYQGNEYEVFPEGELEVGDELAAHWKNVHEFLRVLSVSGKEIVIPPPPVEASIVKPGKKSK